MPYRHRAAAYRSPVAANGDSWEAIDGPAGRLSVHISTRDGPGQDVPLLLLCHELPRGTGGARDAGRAYPGLADYLSAETGLRVVAALLRGTGESDGNFSAGGWLEDLRFVLEREAGPATEVWAVGFGLGAALALRLALAEERVRGVAIVAGPADLAGWVADTVGVLDRCRRSGVISSPGFPSDVDAWAEELVALAPLDAAAHLGSRPLLVIHGSDDGEVPAAAARALADAAAPNGPVDLRIVPGGGHWLRADPRVVATLVGWLDRRR